MKKVYDGLSTQRIIDRILSKKFKIANDKQSNGYKFINALYGIEVDSIRSYLDQGRHYSNFELFDYGLDYKFSEILIPEVIRSGYIYGNNNIPIKITNTEEFYDGVATRLVAMSGINLNGMVPSGILGIEYMRTNKEGSGYLYINTDIDGNTAWQTQTAQSYRLPMTDLVEPVYNRLSGFYPSIQTQSYDTTNTYEFFTTILEPQMKRLYPATKYVYLPKDGIKTNPNAKYLVDYYEPEQYYWDTSVNTYKPVIPTSDKYFDGSEEVYHRVALNNPNGTGVFNINVFDLQFVPISGSLKLFDLDNVDPQYNGIEIPQGGIQTYYYEDVDGKVIYTGYDSIVPADIIKNSGIAATPWKITSWEYVNVDDGVEDFVWKKDPSKAIDNRIRIINPISRYYAEYNYLTDLYKTGITTTSSTKYIREDLNEQIYANIGTDNNQIILDSDLARYDNKIAVTFNGLDVRPGTTVDEISIAGERKNEYVNINTPRTTYLGVRAIPGSNSLIEPHIKDDNEYELNYNINNAVMTPVNGTVPKSIAPDYLGHMIRPSNSGLYINTFYPFNDPSLTTSRIFNVKYRSNTNGDYTIFESHNPVAGWKIWIDDAGYVYIQDNSNTFKTNNRAVNLAGSTIEMLIMYNGYYNYSVTEDRYMLYFRVNNEFYTMFPFLIANDNRYETTIDNYSVAFPDAHVDLSYIKLYKEGSL